MTGFARGTPIAMRSILPAGTDGTPRHVGHSYPAVVIEDSPEVVATFQAAGTVMMDRTGTRDARERLMLPGGWDGGYAPKNWVGDSVVRVYRPGDEWSTWRWLSADGTWSSWFYVNLEEPWTRTQLGFDSNNWILDLVVTRHPTSIRFKDEDELAWSLDHGLLTPVEHERIVAAGARAHDCAVTDAWPLVENWDRWLPEPGWPIPTLPTGWDSST